MSFTSWLQRLQSDRVPRQGQRHHRHSLRAKHRPSLEVLEDRCVPALYAVTPLGNLFASDLNEVGQVVGTADTNGVTHALLWDHGTAIDLGALAGSATFPSAINDLGQVVGYSYVPGTGYHAFLVNPQGGVWFRDGNLDGRNDLMIDLGTLDSSYSYAYDINNAGQVVGQTASGGFLWDATNGMTEVPFIGYAINESGQVAGWSAEGAIFWDPVHGMTALSGGGDAEALNDTGQVAGGGYDVYDPIWGTVRRAIVWDASTGGFTDLGAVPNGIDSYAADINNSGQVVGSGWVATPESDAFTTHDRPFLWDATDGMVDLLGQLLPGSGLSDNGFSNYQSAGAAAINDRGAIVVNTLADYGGYVGAYLLTPVPAGTPSISVTDAPAVTEGNTGTRTATFTVTLSAPSTQPVTVAYATGNGTATAGGDYQAASGTLTFAPGETTKTITVPVLGDRLGEANETFVVNLSSPTNAIITDGQGAGTILDDEPRVSIGDVTKLEGRNGKTSFVFTVTLSAAYDQAVTVSFRTANGTATTSNGDYTAKAGTLTFAPGQTAKTITIEVKGDNKRESNEAFYLDLFGNGSNSVLSKSRGLGTILNDD
ncbi:MAG TPA: Calx-beta domain-containing protein [Gemmataceae bacterium]|jgi:probable HAF family extracellular repeat protein